MRTAKMINPRTLAAALAGLALLAPAGALGQAARPKATAAAKPADAGTMPGFASNLPYDATADSMEVFRDQHLTVLKGNVEVIQGDTRIRTPELRLFSAAKAPNGKPPGPGLAAGSDFGELERMEAAGPVYYITPTQQAKGDRAVYDKTPDTITMFGNVVVTQDKNVVAGDKLVIDQKTGHSTMISDSPQPRRVRGVFYPQSAPPPGGQPPAPASAPAKAAKPAAPAAKSKPKRT